MSLINDKNEQVDVISSDLLYVPVHDIVPENRPPSLNQPEHQVTTLGDCFIELPLLKWDSTKNQLQCSSGQVEEGVTMAEKAAAKKDQQKNKKSKQNEKKKNQENGLKHMNEQHVHDTNHVNHNKKKDKSNKNNMKSAPKKKSAEDSLLKRYFQLFFMSTSFLFLVAGFLYIVDYDKYIKVREGGIAVLNKTVSFLPEEVVHKGKAVLIPVAEWMVRRLNLIINETSTFLNTNPVTKDHWTNMREIGSICGGCLVEYLRTIYNHVTQYWCDAKAKLF